jgi:hypothetical protein
MIIPMDATTLSIWLAFTTIILLITLDFTSTYYGRTNLQINRERLHNITLVLLGLLAISLIVLAINIISS